MSGPDGRAQAPKCPKGILVSGAAIEPLGLSGSFVLALGLGAKNKYKRLGPKLARGWQVPRNIYGGGGLLKGLGPIRLEGNLSGNRNGHNFGSGCPFGDLLVSLESL
ncbi:unnamed protein product [Calypogeia fissa]